MGSAIHAGSITGCASSPSSAGDMWFALGADTQSRRGEEFDDFRQRAQGLLLDLDQTTADNNAFIMRVGEYLAVEFGAKGNAFYLFRWESIPSTLSQKLRSSKERSSISIHGLKNRNHIDRLIHRDSESAGLTWEQKFDYVICPLIGHRPEESARRLGQSFKPRTKPSSLGRSLRPSASSPSRPARTTCPPQ